MKRDLELARIILLEAEKKETPSGWIIPVIDGYSKEEISYHIHLLMQAELVEGIDLRTKTSYEYGIKDLTWKGQEFLEASRDENLWVKVKKFFGPNISTISFEVIKDVLISYTKKNLGLE